MLRSPKERFLESSFSGKWGKVAQSAEFEEALYASFDQLNAQLPLETKIPQEACDSYQQLVGARKLMDIMCNLHVPLSIKPNQPLSGLDYSAGV